MPVSHLHKLIFVHVPKCGGTSVEKVLGINGSDNNGLLRPPCPDLLFGAEENDLGKVTMLQHLKLPEIRQRLPKEVYETYFKFAFVRNPFDRLVSEYRWKMRVPKEEMSFRDFLLNYVKPKYFYQHYCSQYEYIFDENGKPLVDFLGRFENLANDFKKVCKCCGIQVKLPHENRTKHTPYRKYYDEETKLLASELYKIDIEMFKYKF